MSIWNNMSRDDKTAAIKACVSAGMTTHQMADEFRTTRNAVIGHAARNKVALLSPEQAKPIAVKAEPRVKTRTKKKPLKFTLPKRRRGKGVQTTVSEPEIVEEAHYDVGPVDMESVGSRTCRSPLWADGIGRLQERVRIPEIRFCGKQVKEGSPYCPECHARYYTPAEAPKKRIKTISSRRMEW